MGDMATDGAAYLVTWWRHNQDAPRPQHGIPSEQEHGALVYAGAWWPGLLLRPNPDFAFHDFDTAWRAAVGLARRMAPHEWDPRGRALVVRREPEPGSEWGYRLTTVAATPAAAVLGWRPALGWRRDRGGTP